MKETTTYLDPLAVLGAPDNGCKHHLGRRIWRFIPVVNMFAGSITADKTYSFDRRVVTNSIDGRNTSMDDV